METIANHEAVAEALPELIQLETRFLYPFFIREHVANEASEMLRTATIAGHQAAWKVGEPPSLYREEILDPVAQYLFSGKALGPDCIYHRVPNDVGNQWFHDAVVQLSPKLSVPVRLVRRVGIELYVSNQGVGILAVALTPDLPALDRQAATAFNYRIAQLREATAARFHIPHPSEKPEIWERIPEAKRKPAPAPDAPVSERLGVRGGDFSISEIIEEVLRPLASFDLRRVQGTLSVYTVARFGSEMDLEHESIRRTFSSFLSALAQVQEPSHAGTVSNEPGLPNEVLNRRHWTAVSLLGATHLVADQPPPAGLEKHPFNEQRVPRIREKYFVPFVVAFLQRLILQRASDRANSIVLARGDDRGVALSELQMEILRFAVCGHFSEVSPRTPLHQFYRLSQEGLDVPRIFTEVRRAITDLSECLRDERQARIEKAQAQLEREMAKDIDVTTKLSHQMAENIKVTTKLSLHVEWIEVFLVSVYAAHMVHMLRPEGEGSHGGIFAENWHWLVVSAAILGFLVALFGLKPWKHRAVGGEEKASEPPTSRPLGEPP